MNEWALVLSIALAGIAAVFGAMAYFKSRTAFAPEQMSYEQVSTLLRAETDRQRQVIEDQSRGLRQELGTTIKGFQDSTFQAFGKLGDVIGGQVKGFGDFLDAGLKSIDARATAIGTSVSAALAQEGVHQKERLETVTSTIGTLMQRHEQGQEALKVAVEGRLDVIRVENAAKLDEMRKTVDEKLQTTLEARLGESFNRVVEQLERVYKGIGEMQTLAAGVGDLKRVLSNVRARGTFGEVQLSILLEQFLSPEQLVRNAQIKEHSQERVEFAIRFPGRDTEGELLLPIDSKFPHEEYERLIHAAELGDADAVAASSKALETTIRNCAKTIRDKYLLPPKTTDFAILFLPTESLFAEILRRPGLFDQLQREFHVTLAGPTTLTALLNAFQMGFRSLALEKRSSEVWHILGAVRNEFGKYNEVVDRLAKQLNTAAKSVESLGVRTRAMNRKLSDVEKLPDAAAQLLLGPAPRSVLDEQDEEADTRSAHTT